MTSCIIGIDPGHTGSVVCLTSTPHNKWKFVDELPLKAIPTHNVRGTKGKRKRVDIRAVNQFLAVHASRADPEGEFMVFLEDIGAKPPGFKGSARTEFQLARCFGAIEGLLCCELKSYWWRVSPQLWKKHFLLSGEDKELAIAKANEFLDEPLPEKGSKNYRVSRAESCLIAICGWSNRKQEREIRQ